MKSNLQICWPRKEEAICKHLFVLPASPVFLYCRLTLCFDKTLRLGEGASCGCVGRSRAGGHGQSSRLVDFGTVPGSCRAGHEKKKTLANIESFVPAFFIMILSFEMVFWKKSFEVCTSGKVQAADASDDRVLAATDKFLVLSNFHASQLPRKVLMNLRSLSCDFG